MEQRAGRAVRVVKPPAVITCPDEQSMQALGVNLAGLLFRQPSANTLLVTLSGDLGAGKSVIARSMIHAAGYAGHVKSPTYTLIETYDIVAPVGPVKKIAHLDLYRLADPEELYFLGFDDVQLNNDLVIIEWPEKASALLPEPAAKIVIEYASASGRTVRVLSELVGEGVL